MGGSASEGFLACFQGSLVLGQDGIAVGLAYSFARSPAWTVVIVHHLLPGALSQSLL